MTKSKFNTELCNNDMTFNDCELAILRQAVDEAEDQNAVKISDNEQVKKMIEILEDFLRKKMYLLQVLQLIIFFPNTHNFMIKMSKFLIMIFILLMLYKMPKNLLIFIVNTVS